MRLTTVRNSKRADGDLTRVPVSIPIIHETMFPSDGRILSFCGEFTTKSKHTLFKWVDSPWGGHALVSVDRC